MEEIPSISDKTEQVLSYCKKVVVLALFQRNFKQQFDTWIY